MPTYSFNACDGFSAVMAGLVPAIHALLQSIGEIVPCAISAIDKPDFPRPRPMFNRFLTLDRVSNVVVDLKEDQALQSVTFCKSRNQAMTMLIASSNQVVCHPDVQDAVATITHDVNEATH
jgi:hypothetical protein